MMRVAEDLPHKVREIKHIDVPMPDGCRLAARIFMPQDAEAKPVPAILEYIPYRKNDLCAPEDEETGRYYAGHGYAYVRLDLRGAGDSEGLMLDEYLPQELQDGVDAIAWIADQAWCDGNIGMIGISWGGFNGLQIAALQPPALKAIVTICSTDDRYADDVHYMGGCLLIDNFSWASQMFARNALPPDPRWRGEAWRELWLERLEKSGLWLENWLNHQTRDAFWQHGSVCEDYSAIKIPVYAVSGWADGYCRSVLRLMEHLEGPRKGLVGPWSHKRPHVGSPGPAIGFLQETLRWWDEWLKLEPAGIMDEPMLRLFQQDHAPPRANYPSREGKWIAEPVWPSSNIVPTHYALGSGGTLGGEGGGALLTVSSPLDVGMAGGKWCSYAHPGDQPTDQRAEYGGSLTFFTEPLAQPVDIAGEPEVTLRLSADREMAQVAVHIDDIAPDGAATRVTFGVLNLTHRDGHADPKPLVPGKSVTVRVPLKPVAQRFRAGHRIGLAVSTSYFPMIWPSPEKVTITVDPSGSRLTLPVRREALAIDAVTFGEPETGKGPTRETIEPANLYWRVVREADENSVTLELGDGAGTYRLVEDDITIRKNAVERYTIDPSDPSSATAFAQWHAGLERDGWVTSSRTTTRLTCSPTDFIIEAHLEAKQADEIVYERSWNRTIPRGV
ncbi:CocE/NonD family hydrolase [Acuticoccus sp. MNP-M23]|uniref:CocE/NonD family hydrolase n=1 Tax=Acuticoccus sp. MNP-M23 TaxID=3072793 RepID=UPI0028158694|nr:CocE/NonD family hydrolase [Acuticoccus sp. MNP-M23]WMS41861.1 CocE/NonD family hydrolase [Acuticoccus sp. MNP-M23]